MAITPHCGILSTSLTTEWLRHFVGPTPRPHLHIFHGHAMIPVASCFVASMQINNDVTNQATKQAAKQGTKEATKEPTNEVTNEATKEPTKQTIIQAAKQATNEVTQRRNVMMYRNKGLKEKISLMLLHMQMKNFLIIYVKLLTVCLKIYLTCYTIQIIL